MLSDEDDVDPGWSFNLEEKLEADRFPEKAFLRELHGHDFTLAHIQKYGFSYPTLFREKTGLGLHVPPEDFTVSHVKMCVGSRRVLDVMDVNTQKNQQMTMKEWCKYYNDQEKDRLLNVISLEFSHTKLEDYVQSPTIVRQLDWVDTVWPSRLKEAQVDATNSMDDMMYPKVQKYCLMSVKGCYTDFHVDFGGTSVWYHILKGSKIFWMIPPTEKNLTLYENWVLSGKQSDVFFGDTVEKCARIRLDAGNTFFIPSGWIHAVYTPQDSLVFGGNFLHSYDIQRQLQIAKVENATRVPQKFRYPFYTEMLWYVLQKYVYVLLGRNHLDGPEDEMESPPSPSKHIHLTSQELHGLKGIVLYLHQLQAYRKNVPEIIKDPVALIMDVRTVIELHCGDVPAQAVTGRSVLTGIDDSEVRPRFMHNRKYQNQPQGNANNPSGKLASPRGVSKTPGGPRRRRTRCKTCLACQRSDCGECSFCLDMVKFGGPGRAKQTCVMRQCLQPMLPVTAACAVCELDGWGQQPVIPIQKPPRETPSSLMECSVCYEIAHPECYARNYPGIDGIINEDLPNSWECPRCCKAGRNREYRPRHFRARQKSSEARQMSNSDSIMDPDKRDVEVDSESSDSDSGDGAAKRQRLNFKEERTSPSDVRTAHYMDNSLKMRRFDENNERKHNVTNHTNKQLRRPLFEVRPGAVTRSCPSVHEDSPLLDRSVMVPIFRFLTIQQLVEVSLVCRAWARFSLDPSLWRRMDLSHKRLTASHLAGIARRQPEVLVLDWSHIAKKQLGWLIGRLPQLRGLSAQGCSWSGIAALSTCVCPPLHLLDLSFVGGLNDSSLRDILSPPSDSRPGLTDTRTRLRHLRCLKIAGCDISDVSLRYITQHLPRLSVLDISSCTRITDAGVAQLATPTAPTTNTLTSVNVANLRALTDLSLDHLSRCHALVHLNLTHTPLINNAAVQKFLQKRGDSLEVIGKDLTDIK